MSHKVHPKVFRLSEAKDWDSRWLSKRFPIYLEGDFRIRELIKRKLKDCSVQRVEIERLVGRINILISSSRPGLIIGRGGKGVEDLRREIEKKVFHGKQKEELKIDIKEVRNPWGQASLVGQWIAQRLEKRMPYRRVVKQALDKVIIQKEVKGVKIQVSGRLNGAEIARSEKLSKGSLPCQTIRANIDYAQELAHCTYGVIGVKVWIYKGEQFDK